MNQRIKEELEKHKSLVELCEFYGLKPFEQEYYREINNLGKGAFGTVSKCMDIRNRELVAIKYVDINTADDDEEMISNISNLIVEKKLLEKISKRNSPFLPKFYGAFYSLDPQQRENIHQLILVTEAGDHNLKDLLDVRKQMICNEERKSPYLQEEILAFLKQMAEAFADLKKLRVYHSDIKLANIVYSKSRKGYLIIDFGVSKAIPKYIHIDEVGGEEYAIAGSPAFSSPEKKKFLKNENEGTKSKTSSLKIAQYVVQLVVQLGT